MRSVHTPERIGESPTDLLVRVENPSNSPAAGTPGDGRTHAADSPGGSHARRHGPNPRPRAQLGDVLPAAALPSVRRLRHAYERARRGRAVRPPPP